MAESGEESSNEAMSRKYHELVQRIRTVAERANTPVPRIVAVSKTKPVELIQNVYDAGHRHFGENYVQELMDKAPELPSDIKWHFVGHLQSNKAKTIVQIPNLYIVESVDSQKLANKLNNAVENAGREPLNVFVQVNTSGEEQKSGVHPEHAADLSQHVVHSCPNLRFKGLMTIGQYGVRADSFFEVLKKSRKEVASALERPVEDIELSMGMSGDYELAIDHGSTNVRVGSVIFGEREKKG